MVAAGALVGCLAATGCSENVTPRSSAASLASSQTVPAWSDTVEPVWSVSVQTNQQQPAMADGTVVATVSDAKAVRGLSVVAWDASSGNELWRAEGAGSFLFELDGTSR